MLWVDKHRPKTFGEMDLHPEVKTQLQGLLQSGDFPHLLVYGPPGVGKKTRVMAFLESKFGPTALSVKLDHKAVQVSDSKVVEMATLSSPHHIEINPSDAGPTYDRVIVMNTIREMASTVSLASTASQPSFKVVVLNEVEKLSRGAQQALRRTMEKYVATCRLILVCSSTSRLIPPLKSRCLSIRIPAPETGVVARVLQDICVKESVSGASPTFLSAVAAKADGNLRRAILMLEAAKAGRANFSGDGSDVPLPDWKLYVVEIAQDILAEQTPRKLYEVRQKYYELLAHCIPAEIVLREVMIALLDRSQPQLHTEIIRQAAIYDHQMKQGSKPIMHLEAFTAMVMARQKSLQQ
jgi:replication factor C subunit 3/5